MIALLQLSWFRWRRSELVLKVCHQIGDSFAIRQKNERWASHNCPVAHVLKLRCRSRYVGANGSDLLSSVRCRKLRRQQLTTQATELSFFIDTFGKFLIHLSLTN